MKRASLIAVALVACACSGSVAERSRHTLEMAQGATNAARAAFVDWDAAHQAQIVSRATSLDAGKAALAAYRARRAVVMHGFATSYSAIAAAATLLPLVAAGKRSEAELVVLVVAAADAAKRLAADIAAFREDL